MARFKVVLERPSCVGCGNCENVCPDYWEMADDGLTHLKESQHIGENEERELDDIACNEEAAESCPVNCIYVYQDGKKIV